jgi:glutathione peroxidase
MKPLLLIFLLLFVKDTTVYDFTPLSIDGKAIDLSQYKGKKILIVNTASVVILINTKTSKSFPKSTKTN